MEYTFEKIRNENRFQVRLNGEFVMYVESKESDLVDRILKENDWDSREQFYEACISGVI